ncbi:MAG TPA: hypothetical protein VK784_01260 [Pseudonocardiaceae bacterium]|jgi:hypothetical protein|nr:hypothetical protein [Pseudonocardiaceae bacterium]
MSTKNTDAPPATDPGAGSGGTGPAPGSAGGTPPNATLREQVADILGSLLGAGKAKVTEGTGDGAPGAVGAGQARGTTDARFDVSEQVRKAVSDIHETEQRDSLLTGLKSDIDALKAAGEKQPLQERKVERVMGWRLPEER